MRAYGTIGDLSIFIKALKSKTDFTVLSRPSIFTSNNQKGVISSGERIAIPTGSNSFGGTVNGNVSTQIEYQDVVLKLEVIPLVNSDNEITMQIALLNDEQNGTQTIEGGAGGQTSQCRGFPPAKSSPPPPFPTTTRSCWAASSSAGMARKRAASPSSATSHTSAGCSPTTWTTKDRSELMVFIQPSIVNSDRSLYDVQADMDNRYKVSRRCPRLRGWQRRAAGRR